MDMSYFSYRKPFSVTAHPYDLGTFFGLWPGYGDNHFLLKIYRLTEDQLSGYYQYHLHYALKNEIASEEQFYRHVWQMVALRIRHYEMQDPFSTDHGDHTRLLSKLKLFQNYLHSIDQWDARRFPIVIAEKEDLIQVQKTEIERLRAKLLYLNDYEVSLKVMIAEGYLPTFVDLIQQIRELDITDTRKLLKSDHKVPFAKMIAKYFSHGGKDIPIETARNYFVEKKGDHPIKGTSILPAHRLFKIVAVNRPKET